MVILGIFLIVLGGVLLFFRNASWRLQEMGNRAEGITSERTPQFDATQIAIGIVLLVVGGICLLLGIIMN